MIEVSDKIIKEVLEIERAIKVIEEPNIAIIDTVWAGSAETLVDVLKGVNDRLTRAAEILHRQKDAKAGAIRALRDCAELFKQYSLHHMAKEKPDVEKSKRNYDAYQRMMLALATLAPDDPVPEDVMKPPEQVKNPSGWGHEIPHWQVWFDRYGKMVSVDVAPGWRSTAEEQYQAFKERMIHELELQVPMTPEQREKWRQDMVMKK